MGLHLGHRPVQHLSPLQFWGLAWPSFSVHSNSRNQLVVVRVSQFLCSLELSQSVGCGSCGPVFLFTRTLAISWLWFAWPSFSVDSNSRNQLVVVRVAQFLCSLELSQSVGCGSCG